MPFLKILNNLKAAIVIFLLSGVVFWLVLEDDARLFDCNIEVYISENQPAYLDKPIADYFRDRDISHEVIDETIIFNRDVGNENECRIDFLTEVNNVLKSINEVQEKRSLESASLLSQKINALTEELQGLQTQLYELKAKEEEINEKNQQLVNEREELVNKTNYLKTQKERLLLIYTPNHPDIISLDKEIAFYEDKLSKSPEPEKLSTQLKEDILKKESVYDQKAKKLTDLNEELKEAAEVTNNPLAVESVAVLELESASPSKNFKIFLFSSLIGLFVFFISALSDKKIYSAKELKHFKSLNLISKMPKITKRGKFFSIPFDGRLKTKFFLEEVANSLKEKRVIFITSPDIKAGKTTAALNLAAFLSKEGKRVVLVDFNFKNAALTKKTIVKKEEIFIDDATREQQVDKKIFNFSHLALEKPKLEEFITKQGLDRLSILFARPKKRADLFTYHDLIKRLKETYNYVICDCSSFCEDLLRLSEEPESELLIIIRRGHTKKSHVRRVEESLNFDKIGIKGVVFNICT